jgi:O-antigen/teichoic acid export membrane protein
MKREFFINIILLVGINLLIKPIYIFGIDRVVQNAVGKEAFGLYFAVFNFTFLLQIINDFGIHTFNNKHISQNRNLLKSYFPNVLMLKTLLAGGYLLVIFLTAIPSGYTAAKYLPFLGWLCLIHILNSLMLYLRSNISALGWYRTDSWLSSLNKFLMILVCAPLLWINDLYEQFQIEWFIYAQIATLVVTALVALWLTRKELVWTGWKLDFSFLKRIAMESYPYALAIFLMTVYTRVDAVMIERMLEDGEGETGIYAGAYRLLDASNMIGFLFAGLLLPMFARMLKDGEDYRDLLRFSLQIILAGAIALSLPVYFFREEIMVLLYKEGTAYWGTVMGWLILSFIAGCVIYVYSALLTAGEKLMRMNRIFVVGVLLNIILNYFLIQSDKAAGAALATLLTQSFIAIALVGLAIREFKLPINTALIGRPVLFALLTGLVCYIGTDYLPFDWHLNFILTGIMALVLAFILKLISVKDLITLMKERG